MTTALRTAFDELFDDAAIFPPGNLPLPEAARAHRDHDGNPTVGPFVCSLARLTELDALLDAPLDASVVIPAGPFELPPLQRVRLVAVERHAEAEGTTPDVTTYTEFPCLPTSAVELATVSRIKFRTGGLVAGAFPGEATLAAAIEAAVTARVPFKCTAGLHRAVRHTGPDGFEHHGFLNVLLAAHAASTGAAARPVLAARDGAVIADRVRALNDDEMSQARRAFVSFGTCSIAEPTDDLRALGLLS